MEVDIHAAMVVRRALAVLPFTVNTGSTWTGKAAWVSFMPTWVSVTLESVFFAHGPFCHARCSAIVAMHDCPGKGCSRKGVCACHSQPIPAAVAQPSFDRWFADPTLHLDDVKLCPSKCFLVLITNRWSRCESCERSSRPFNSFLLQVGMYELRIR